MSKRAREEDPQNLVKNHRNAKIDAIERMNIMIEESKNDNQQTVIMADILDEDDPMEKYQKSKNFDDESDIQLINDVQLVNTGQPKTPSQMLDQTNCRVKIIDYIRQNIYLMMISFTNGKTRKGRPLKYLIDRDYQNLENDSFVYQGEVQNGIAHGKGHYYVKHITDGKTKLMKIYSGEFKHGFAHGYGYAYSYEMIVFKGIFDTGFPKKGTFNLNNGLAVDAVCIQGFIHGKAILRNEEYKLLECDVSMGFLNGVTISYQNNKPYLMMRFKTGIPVEGKMSFSNSLIHFKYPRVQPTFA